MKKTLCVILCFVIVLCSFSPFGAYASTVSAKAQVKKATSDLADMQYNDGELKEKLLADDNNFITVGNRIIIKTDCSNVETFGSTSSAFAYGYGYVQYSDNLTASKAYAEFEKMGLSPEYDTISTVDFDEGETVVSTGTTLNGVYSSVKVRDERYEWAYSACDVDEALNFYKYRVGREVIVGVMDSGIQYDIKPLKDRTVRTNADFSSNATGDEMDKFGHGTQVASTVALCTPSNVKIEGFKVSNDQTVTDSSVLLALGFIKQMSRKPDVINMSFSGSDMDSHIESEINELTDMGVVFVGSSGNDGKEVTNYPASYDNVIAVSAVNKDGTPCDFANYGNYVDVSAPGYFTSYKATSGSNAPSYVYSRGTSFAAPMVSAAAAIILSEYRNYTPKQVKDKIIENAVPFKEKDCNKKYGKGIVNFSNLIDAATRCKAVTADNSSGVYQNPVDVKLSCQNTLVDIIYTTDGTLPSTKNGTVYTEPVTVSKDTRLIAAAFEKTGSVFHGKFFCADYYIGDSSEFVVDEKGTLKSYLGGNKDVVVPQKIGDVTVDSVGENCFRYTDVQSVTLPDSVKTLGEYSFAYCSSNGDFVSNGVKTVDEKAFSDSDFDSIVLEKCNEVSPYSFQNSTVKTVKLGELAELQDGIFENCQDLQTVYCPKVLDFKSNLDGAFENCKSLKTVFAPKASSMFLDIPSNVDLYVNGKLSFKAASNNYKYTFIAQFENSINTLRDYILALSCSNFVFKDSGNYAKSRGAQIRATDSGLRFGFNWSKMDELESLADSVEYGFVMSYSDTDNLDINNAQRKVKAAKTEQNGSKTDFNLVIKNIPPEQKNTVISVRAFVNIDGWYSYSPIVKRSYNQVATSVINDDEVDDDIKDSVAQTMA